MTASLEFRLVNPELTDPLEEFFAALESAGDSKSFHPHPLTPEAAQRIANYHGKDLYYVAINEGTILAYGMLRGWEEGYTVPSLGIAVHPEFRGCGLGVAMMHFLHIAASCRGATEIRLKVYPENIPAIRMYEGLGYKFSEDHEDGQRIGILAL